MKVLRGFRYSALMLAALLSSCSLASEHLPADTTPVPSITIITHHGVSAETGFSLADKPSLQPKGRLRQ